MQVEHLTWNILKMITCSTPIFIETLYSFFKNFKRSWLHVHKNLLLVYSHLECLLQKILEKFSRTRWTISPGYEENAPVDCCPVPVQLKYSCDGILALNSMVQGLRAETAGGPLDVVFSVGGVVCSSKGHMSRLCWPIPARHAQVLKKEEKKKDCGNKIHTTTVSNNTSS